MLTKHRIILLLFIVSLSGCFDNGDCYSTKTDLLSISFRNFLTNELEAVKIQEIALVGSDIAFYEQEVITSAMLPLNPNTTSLKINFTFEATTHELLVGYTTTPQLISPDCSIELRFTNIHIHTHDFDSVAVLAATLDETTVPNIVLYP